MTHNRTGNALTYQERDRQNINEEAILAIFNREATELLGIITDVPLDVTDDEISNMLAWLPDYVPYPYSNKSWYGQERFIRLIHLDNACKSIVFSHLESRRFPFIRSYDEIVKYSNLHKLQHQHTKVVYYVKPDNEYVILAVVLTDGKLIEAQRMIEILDYLVGENSDADLYYQIQDNACLTEELHRMPNHIINEVIIGLHEDKTFHL